MSIRSEVDGVAHGARRMVHRNREWIVWMGRAGYVARGVLYLTIGVLAAMVAAGKGGKLADSKGALDELYRQPAGLALLVVMSIGLLGYGLWCSIQAVLDPAHEAPGRKGLLKRAGRVISALIHFGLAAYAFSKLNGSGGGGEMDARGGTAKLLAWEPFGAPIVAAVGVFLAGFGVREVLKGWRAKLDEQLDLSSLSSSARRRVVTIARLGIAARGVVFAIAGGFLVVAAVKNDPDRARGFAESLQALREAPFGKPLLAVVAIGLIAFAIYQLVEARHRRLLDRR